MKPKRNDDSKRLRWQCLTFGAFALCAVSSQAGRTIFPPGGESACEAEWISRQAFDTLPTINSLRFIENDAKRGYAAAQYRLGLVFKTLDGQWTTPADYSYNIQWLEKAVQQGSKSAAAQLATIQYTLLKPPAIDHLTYVQALIAAAQEERNPWVATTLMDLTRDRWGDFTNIEQCKKYRKIEECNGFDLLLKIDTAKWAEIAADGGNPNAQEWLCRAATEPGSYRVEFGQGYDENLASKWCNLAVHHPCSYWVPSGSTKLNNQLWRGSRYFFIPTK
jgi:hypothetical protein